MIFTESIETVVRRRRSVRTFSESKLSTELKAQIGEYISTLTSPFSGKTSFSIIETELEKNGAKLGTYGFIKGANVFIVAAIKNSEDMMLTLGYEFEKLILFLTTLGLGTCWLGGSFNRGEFSKTMDLSEDMICPTISPVGYPEKMRLKETMMRGVVGADKRKPWDTLFYAGDFNTPLTEVQAGDFVFPLEMVRLGPSASNKQPWRIVKAGKLFHFYEMKTPGYSKAFEFDMQSIDMGIAACHFQLSAQEKGIEGSFNLSADPHLTVPEHYYYRFSWSVE